MTEDLLWQAESDTYSDGGEPTILMSAPTVISKISKYFIDNTGRAATFYTDVGQKESKVRAKTAVRIIESDFTVFELHPNRTQQPTGTVGGKKAWSLFGLDPKYWRFAYLIPLQGKKLARTGLAESIELQCSFGIKALNEKSSFVIADLDASVPMTKS
jgi:hypothetical protein